MRLLHVFGLPLLVIPFTAIPLLAQNPKLSSSSSQQSPAAGYASPLFNATTRNVILDAVVTDKKGNVVTGLTRNDFAIREDNAPQQIRSFDAVTAGISTEDATPHTILLVDELNTRFEDMAYTRYSVNLLLHRDGVKLDQPTALYILGNDGLHVLQGFTRDPAAIDAALRSHKAVLPWRMQHNFYFGLERINVSMSALQQIAIASTGVPGHKNIVWISPGLPIFGALQMNADAEKQLFDSIRHLSDQLLKARVSIYSVDPRGVQVNFAPTNFANNNFAYAAYLNALTQTNDAAFGNLAIQTLATQTVATPFTGAMMSTVRSRPASPTAIPTTRSPIHPPTRTSTANFVRSRSASSAGRISKCRRAMATTLCRTARRPIRNANCRSWPARCSHRSRSTASPSPSATPD
jgi:VWFA-related protein